MPRHDVSRGFAGFFALTALAIAVWLIATHRPPPVRAATSSIVPVSARR